MANIHQSLAIDELWDDEKPYLTPPERLNIWEWVETRRYLGTRSEEQGPMKLDRTPYVRSWLESAIADDVEGVVVCASAQVAKTEFGLSVCGYYADVLKSPVLVALGDEMTAKHISRDRIRKMFEDSPDLYPLIDKAPVLNNEEIELTNGAYVNVVWASSVAALATKAFRVVIADEIDKPGYYVKTSEAMPLSLIRERTESFFAFKHIFFSTPTVETGNITVELMSCDVIYDWHVPCPICGTFQPLRFSKDHAFGFKKGKYRADTGEMLDLGGVLWDGGSEATQGQVSKARYQCGSCGGLWTTAMKNRAVVKGKAVARQEIKGRVRKVGHHINRLYSLLGKSGSLDKIVAAFLEANRSKNPRNLQGFVNSTLADPWMPDSRPRRTDTIIQLADDRPRGVVPGGGRVACLLAGIDTQDDGFYYEIRAFGYGLDRESWCIREGKVPTFESLARVLWDDQYTDADGLEYPIHLSMQDAMGHRTAEVYDFCRVNRGKIFPTMGRQTMATPFTYSKIEFYPGSKKPIPGGLQLIRFDTNHFKNQLAGILEIAPGDPGCWHYHGEITQDWARQMTVEVLDEKGLWCNPLNKANHAWDCGALLLLAHEIRGVAYIQKPDPSGNYPTRSGRRVLSKGVE